MAQRTFAGTVPPATNSLANLDLNFTELYGLANYYSTPVYTGTTPKFYADANGDFGVGVLPAAWGSLYRAMQIGAQGTIWSLLSATGGFYLSNNEYWDGSFRKYLQTDFATEYAQVTGAHVWSTAASGTAGGTVTMTERERLDNSGNWFVGTTNIDPTFNRVNGFVVKPGGGFLTRSAAAGSDWGLSVTSGVHVTFYSDNGSARVTGGNISTNGSTTAYNTTSDARLKDHVHDVPDGFGAVFDAIRVRSFRWKDSGTLCRAGFIAQELHAVAPEAVTPGLDGGLWSVDPAKLVPLLVAQVQELRARLARLESAAG